MTRDSEERRHGEDAKRLSAPARPNGAEGNRPDSIAHKQLIERLTYKSSEFFSNAYRAAGQGIADEQQQRALHSYVVLGESVKARSARAILSLITRAEAAEAQRDELRGALIACGREAGAILSDQVSSEFLKLIPGEVKAKIAALHNTTNQREEAQSK